MKKVTKLKFKGDAHSESKKRKIPSDTEKRTDIESNHNTQDASSIGKVIEEEANFEPKVGTGRITSSSMIVHGHFTKFMDEIKPGDARKCVDY